MFGLKSYGEAAKILAQGTVDGAAAFFGRICLPAAEEFGLFLRDKVHAWRTKNLVAVTQAAEQFLGNNTDVHAHPRIVSNVIENGSWSDDLEVQKMWGGLLASSCTNDGEDDSNLMFISLLGSLTKAQARMLNFICENSNKCCRLNGLPTAQHFRIDLETLKQISGIDDIFRLDRELDHLRGLELIFGGFTVGLTTSARVAPTAIAMNMYVRCHGSRKSPREFFSLNVTDEDFPKDKLLFIGVKNTDCLWDNGNLISEKFKTYLQTEIRNRNVTLIAEETNNQIIQSTKKRICAPVDTVGCVAASLTGCKYLCCDPFEEIFDKLEISKEKRKEIFDKYMLSEDPIKQQLNKVFKEWFALIENQACSNVIFIYSGDCVENIFKAISRIAYYQNFEAEILCEHWDGTK